MTFDKLALEHPEGGNLLIIRGSMKRKCDKHFGKAPGTIIGKLNFINNVCAR